MKKGFTLIELLAVLTLLGIIVLVSVPSIISTNKKSKENNYNEYKKNIENAAEIYVETHPDTFEKLKNTPNTTETATVSIDDLISDGLVEGGLVDPSTNQKVRDESITVLVKNVSGVLTYTYQIP
jgi:prepilin-type N-terminal cleavage/methylation domain-containing protein